MRLRHGRAAPTRGDHVPGASGPGVRLVFADQACWSAERHLTSPIVVQLQTTSFPLRARP